MGLNKPALYDPGQVLASFAGNPIVGYAPGSMITVARSEDAFKVKVGADGHTARTRSRNKSGEITIRLLASSPLNDIFSALYTLDQTLGAGMGPFAISDLNSRTVLVAPFAWIKKLAEVEYSDEAAEREWVLQTSGFDGTVGGSI